MLMVELLARMPDLRRRIQRDHVADAAGRCRDCHGVRWPCQLYQLADQADRLPASGAPASFRPPPPYPNPAAPNPAAPIPPPEPRRDPGPPSPAGAAPAWPAPPIDRPPPVPPPRSGSPYGRFSPFSRTPEVPVPKQGGDPSVGPTQLPGPAAEYVHGSTGLGGDRNAPPRHSLGFPASSPTRSPEPRRELASVLEDVLRWSR